MIKKITAVVLTAMLAFGFTGCDKNYSGAESNENSIIASRDDGGQLELLKQETKLSQEQVLSRIKADKLIKNNGYVDGDELTIMISLPDKSLVDSYLDGASESYKSVGDYAQCSAGAVQTQSINIKQERLIAELNGKGLIKSVEHRYSTVVNAIAVTVSYENIEKIQKINGVAGITFADTYNRPQAISVGEVNSIVNNVDVYETGIFNSGTLPQYTGDGTAVAILDSGFDCSHSVFQNSDIKSHVYTESNLAARLGDTNAAKTTPNLKVSDVYYSDKIPFKYDYADKDSDVFPYDSNHGTHVAGIIGGYDDPEKEDRITGIAKNTQLVLMKVFPDLEDGAETDDILAALEDAALLGVDAINMSLGSSCGFARECDNDPEKGMINKVYDNLKKSGISVITAASNSYSSGFGGAQGNTNMVTNPDSATVGSPSTYEASLSVASISGVKSKYLIGNGEQVLFFNESNNVAGKPNDFVKELGIADGETRDFEYVTVPGTGIPTSYASIKNQINGKIALIRRGDNTFEQKAQIAKEFGAIACIIYNNIDGEILMSMGKSDHIPTISISKDDGSQLAKRNSGVLKIGYDQQAGPFMSDFSSWGPTPSLGIKPEITAHGGEIKSAVPGGGYDKLSGTSMATPNLCGIVVLIRQYLKDIYPNLSAVEYSKLCNQLLMSSATIIKNKEGNPYSPRKQGAGLASLYNAVTTKAIITVEGQDRPKLELGDDKERKGVYTLEFGVKNLSASELSYEVGLESMTESVSTSDKNHVAEKAYMLGGQTSVSLLSGEATLLGNILTVSPNGTAKIKIVYTMSQEDKNYITSSFPYGMYVEGFIKLTAKDDATKINLNAPYLAFFGDWTEAPMFDKTYYEVESQAHDASIDAEDKLKADYYATTPYGSYFYNYIIPLGTYLYDLDTVAYEAIPASEEHIAISDILGTIDGISSIYGGLLRGAKEMRYTITDKITGETVYSFTDYNAHKAASNGGQVIPYYEFLRLSSRSLRLVNNRRYEFKMQGVLDYGDGGLSTNVRNTFAFDFAFDNEAPVIKSASYEKVYDKSLKKDRYYITLTVYDNQFVQAITPLAFTSSSSYAILCDNPIPVYSSKGADNKVRFEITEYLDAIYSDALIGSALSFSVDDYALNSNIYMCQLPGTRGDFRFTSNGKSSGRPLTVLTAYEGDVVDLTEYLYSTDATLDENKDYLKHLVWSTYNPSIIKADPVTKTFKYGEAVCLKEGRTQVTVSEKMDGKQATITINVKARPAASTKSGVKSAAKSATVDEAELESLNFIYFDTLFAYSRAAQTSEINDTGDRIYISGLKGGNVSFYPGEKIKLSYAVTPWYIADKLEYEYATSNESVVKVESDGTVTALKEGNATVTLSVAGSHIKARISITVKSEFVIENRTLIAYKGLGGAVTIPDDEGILYIGAYAFCLYDTDRSIELTDDDFDANKIPAMNTSVTSVIVPEGVEEIQKYAFYNCSGLRSVSLPSTVKFIKEYAFNKDEKLTTINLNKVEAIGAHAFHGCKSLEAADLSSCYSIGASGFEGCSSLLTIDLSHLRNAAEENIRVTGGINRVGRTFKDCTSLKSVTLTENTKLCREMFVNTGIEQLDIYEKISVPTYAFARSSKLTKVIFHNSLLSIEKGAFCESQLLESVEFKGSVVALGPQVFFDTPKLTTFNLPDCDVKIAEYCFVDSGITTLGFGENTRIASLGASVFSGAKLNSFNVAQSNKNYSVDESGALLLSKDGKTIILAAQGKEYCDLVLDGYDKIADGAFASTSVTTVTFKNKDIYIGDYAFNSCENLTTVTFPADISNSAHIGTRAFNACSALTQIVNLDKVKEVGNYAFANTALDKIVLGDNAIFGEGTFFKSKVTIVTVGKNSVFKLGAFQNCDLLKNVVMPADGGVSFGKDCFANCVSLIEMDLSKTDKIVASEAFYGCTSLLKVDLNGVTEIGSYAFADCASLLNAINAMSVKIIGEGAFSRQTQNGRSPIFDKIALNSVESIGKGAFMGCAGLSEITLPATMTRIEGFAFAQCANLQSVTLADTITRIGEYAFRGCENLAEINLGNITFFGENAFYGATYLTQADLSSAESIGAGAFANTYVSNNVVANKLVSIGDSAFAKTAMVSFSAPKLKELGQTAFYKNYRLTAFTFGTDIDYIGSMAFLGCSSLLGFKYADGAEVKSSGEINSYAKIEEGALYTKLSSGGYELKAVPAGLIVTTLTVPEGVVRIDMYAGNRNPYITKIILPDSLKIIGNYAFNGYTKLTQVEFKSYSAPALEAEYYDVSSVRAYSGESDFFPKAVLEETAPAYSLLHNQFDLFGLELTYFTFKGLAGSFKSIRMILPRNAADGYEGVVFEAYFGKVSDADRTEYAAKDSYTASFIENGEKVAALDKIVLADAKLVNAAVTALNSMTQKLTDYGYTQERADELVAAVRAAKQSLTKIQVATAGRDFKNILSGIATLQEHFTADRLELLRELYGQINSLGGDELILLKETEQYKKYVAISEEYNLYSKAITEEGDTAATAGNAAVNEDSNVMFYVAAAIVAVAAVIAAVIAAVAIVFVIKKKSGGIGNERKKD